MELSLILNPSPSYNEGSNSPEKQTKIQSVLIVDDNPINLIICKTKILSKFVCEIVTVDSGEEAIQEIDDSIGESPPFTAIIMDENMGSGFSGIETTKRIRKMEINSVFPFTPIMGWSAEEETEERYTNWKNAGANGFCGKTNYEKLFTFLEKSGCKR